MFKLVVVEKAIVTAEYFLDKMKPYELHIICDSLHLRTRDEWEQARLISYLIAQSNSKKRLKPSDILEFPWDNNIKPKQPEVKPRKEPQAPQTKKEVEEIRQQALQRELKLKQQGII